MATVLLIAQHKSLRHPTTRLANLFIGFGSSAITSFVRSKLASIANALRRRRWRVDGYGRQQGACRAVAWEQERVPLSIKRTWVRGQDWLTHRRPKRVQGTASTVSNTRSNQISVHVLMLPSSSATP